MNWREIPESPVPMARLRKASYLMGLPGRKAGRQGNHGIHPPSTQEKARILSPSGIEKGSGTYLPATWSQNLALPQWRPDRTHQANCTLTYVNAFIERTPLPVFKAYDCSRIFYKYTTHASHTNGGSNGRGLFSGRRRRRQSA